jgi:hypothetical protein
MQYVHVQPPTVSVSAHAPIATASVAATIISFFVISLFLSNRFPYGAMGSSRPTVPPRFTTSQWPVLELPIRFIKDLLVNALI